MSSFAGWATERVVVDPLEEVGCGVEKASLLAERGQGPGILERKGKSETKLEQPIELSTVALEIGVRQVVDHSDHDEAVVDRVEVTRREGEPNRSQPVRERVGWLGTSAIERIEKRAIEWIANQEVAGHADCFEWNAGAAGD